LEILTTETPSRRPDFLSVSFCSRNDKVSGRIDYVLALLVAMHSLTILGPTLIKIGYVMRLLAQYRIRAPRMIPQTA
jgi:hypothetical protein